MQIFVQLKQILVQLMWKNGIINANRVITAYISVINTKVNENIEVINKNCGIINENIIEMNVNIAVINKNIGIINANIIIINANNVNNANMNLMSSLLRKIS